jgi:hypothetical protein
MASRQVIIVLQSGGGSMIVLQVQVLLRLGSTQPRKV